MIWKSIFETLSRLNDIFLIEAGLFERGERTQGDTALQIGKCSFAGSGFVR